MQHGYRSRSGDFFLDHRRSPPCWRHRAPPHILVKHPRCTRDRTCRGLRFM